MSPTTCPRPRHDQNRVAESLLDKTQGRKSQSGTFSFVSDERRSAVNPLARGSLQAFIIPGLNVIWACAYVPRMVWQQILLIHENGAKSCFHPRVDFNKTHPIVYIAMLGLPF